MIRSMYKQPFKIIVYAFLLLLSLLLFGVINSEKASAEVQTNNIFPNPYASKYHLYMTLGGGEFEQPYAGSVITSDAPGTFVVTIEEAHWCNNDNLYAHRALDLPKDGDANAPYKETEYSVHNVDSFTNLAGGFVAKTGFVEQCVNRDQTITFTMGASEWNGALQRYVALFYAKTGARNDGAYLPGVVPGAWENSFRIVATGPGTIKALPVPQQYLERVLPPGAKGFLSLSNRNRPTGSDTTNYEIRFNTVCSQTNPAYAALQFFDADNGTYQDTGTYPKLTYQFKEGSRSSSDINTYSNVPVEAEFSAGFWVPTLNPGNINGGNGEASTKIRALVNGDRNYYLNIDGLSWINAITYNIEIPVELLNGNDNCATGQPPTISIHGATCDKIWGVASDPDVPNNGLVVHLRMEYPYPTKTELDGDLRTGVGGYWEYNVDPKYKDTGSRVVYASVLGMRADGSWDEWADAPNSGTFTHGPCYAAQCVSASIENIAGTVYPNSQYKVHVTFRNTGSATWYNTDTGGASQAGVTDNYLTNGGGVEYLTMNGSSVAPGADIEWISNAYTLPSYGATYNSYWKLGNFSVPGAWFGPQCGLPFTVEQGRVGDADDWTTYRDATINTCSMGNVNTGASGFFTFAIPQGWGFCVALVSSPTQPDDVFTRPFDWGGAQGYRGCPANAVCTGANYYGSWNGSAVVPDQVAGQNGGGFDRTIDYGYDLAFAWKPVVSCTIVSTGALEIGESFTPQVRVNNAPPASGSSGAITGTVTYSATAAGSFRSVSISPAIPRGGSQVVNMPPPVSFPTPNTYKAVADVSWSSSFYTNQVTTCPESRVVAGNKPYMKIYGGDVWSGGEFGTGACVAPAGSGGVAGWAKSVVNGAGWSQYSGSSSQLTVTSLLFVNDRQFYSASTRPSASGTGNTYQPKGLNFTNTTGDQYGGDFSNGGRCFTDYYGKTYDATLYKDDHFNGGGIPDDRSAYKLPNNTDATFGDFEIKRGQQTAVYIDGDLYIDGDITYQNRVWRRRSDIPYFAVIVKGNIYIDNDVTRLDGLYIAQPDGASGGHIYTCFPVKPTKGPAYDGTTLYPNCQQQLSVNGSLIGKRVHFLRVRNSLKDAGVDEIPDFGTGAGTNAAEVINYSPDMYLADSPLKQGYISSGSSEAIKYDAISGMPPIF